MQRFFYKSERKPLSFLLRRVGDIGTAYDYHIIADALDIIPRYIYLVLCLGKYDYTAVRREHDMGYPAAAYVKLQVADTAEHLAVARVYDFLFSELIEGDRHFLKKYADKSAAAFVDDLLQRFGYLHARILRHVAEL